MTSRNKMKADEAAVQVLSEINQYIADYANQKTSQNIHEVISFWENMSREERMEMALRIDERDISSHLDEKEGSIGGTMITTVLLLRLLGLNNIASRMEFLTHSIVMHLQMRETMDELKFKMAMSRMNKVNASGAKNANYNESIAIMQATWGKYPNASKNGMVEKVYSHFNGTVSRQTLERWIKQNKFGPQKIIRPSPSFSLVIPS